ncbi:MAG: hypothetical protein ABI763_04695 [Bacteroidota bacterium]
MKNKNFWIDFSVLNLCITAFLGMVLRSKMLFNMPFLDFNNLLEAHYHFAIAGWVTLVLMVLMTGVFFWDSASNKPFYRWLFAGIAISSWSMLIVFYFMGNCTLAEFFSFFFILITYVFGWMFIKDILKAKVSRTVLFLSILAIVCLILSSGGTLMLTYLFSVKSLSAILYRDALYTYLHFTYNGFFTLAVFSLLIHKIWNDISSLAKRNVHSFSILLCCSILPSLFLSFLWQDPNIIFRVLAISGSVLLLLTLVWFIISLISLRANIRTLSPLIRNTGLVSMSAFMLKLLLQSFTIYTPIGNAVFGDRPLIIGYLHLVFLVFVTLFILIYFVQEGILDIKNRFTKGALITFTIGVVLNEAILISQGLGAIFIKSSHFFPSLLWFTSIIIFIGATLIGFVRGKANSA